jgi:hypothetical protein
MIDEIEERKREVLMQVEVHQNEIRKLYRVINDIDIELRNVRNNQERVAPEHARFVRACPDPECRGFLSTQWKCGLCKKWSCPDCHEVKGFERECDHTCNPDNVATAQLLARDTKPCPNCGTGIFKIDGCNQMWCTDCHTAFDWRTGRIETNIHNPHYYEWLRRNSPDGQIPRNPGDHAPNPCGNGVGLNNISRDIALTANRYADRNKPSPDVMSQYELLNSVNDKVRSILHIEHVEMPRFRYNRLINNERLRVLYMRNMLSQDDFKRIVQQNNKKHEKMREIHNLLNMFHTASSDILMRIHDDVWKQTSNVIINRDALHRIQISTENTENLLKELDELRSYVNGCFEDIGKAYHSKIYVVNPQLRMV